MEKYVYLFNEGNKEMRNLLGGKGANLAEMSNLGLPVPTGFVVTTESCLKYYENNEQIDQTTIDQIYAALEKLEKLTGKRFGDPENPLLVSVRSGSRVSMPGMMDTVLNLGINDEVCEGLAKLTNNKRFAYDSYRRFIQMFADVVMGYPKESFEKYFDDFKEKRGKTSDLELDDNDMYEVVKAFKENYFKIAGKSFPVDPKEQLIESIKAVFRSWNNERANVYRRLNNIPNIWGTAVNVQEMVYGNTGELSGSGVAFTRNPANGNNEIYGEYMVDAQGEDVVAGIRTPEPISYLKERLPDVYNEFVNHAKILEKHHKDMQDLEFTVENGKLFILQTRSGKRTAQAAVKIAVDLYNEGIINKKEAIMSVNPNQLDALLHPTFSKEALETGEKLTTGLAASPGASTGRVYFTAEDIIEASLKTDEKLILARLETSPEDIEGMNTADGILTIRGGMTSHAAVVARGMGKSAVCGAEELTLNEKEKTITTKNNIVIKEGDFISLDGSTGNVYLGKLKTDKVELSDEFNTFMKWVDEYRDMGIRANADLPKDAEVAKSFGAEGIGLCRTEHMFFEAERIFSFRKMILAKDQEGRKKALKEILPHQINDFEGLFRSMSPHPVIVRLLDPPLHEFLPKEQSEILSLSKDLNITKESLINRIKELEEFNPMMGHRGCRLAITYPEITIMQTQAIITAAINVAKENKDVSPEIMIPLASDEKELKFLVDLVKSEADRLIKEANIKLKYFVGTMIELPRACLLADELATHADFFSFGTNDLTQMTYGFSRDDATKFLSEYYKKQIFTTDPFATIDISGVGKLMEIGVKKGKEVNPDLEIGICGEHGGESASIELCYNLGMDYVSCSPFRVPIARLAAAQAAIKQGGQK